MSGPDRQRTYYLFESWPFRLEVTDQAVNVKVRFRGSVSIPLESIVDVQQRRGSISIVTTQGVYPRWGLSTPDRAEAAARAIAEARANAIRADAVMERKPIAATEKPPGQGAGSGSATHPVPWSSGTAERDSGAVRAGGATIGMPARDGAPRESAIAERISAAESDLSTVIREGFRAGMTADEVVQVVIAATTEGAGDAEWARSLRDRLRMHGLDEIARVLREDPAKAEEFANFQRDGAEQMTRAEAGAPAPGTTGPPSLARENAAFEAYECLAHPGCGRVTALGQSGHGHHSDVTGRWCWHFSERWIGPIDQAPPEGSDAARRRAQGCIDGDPAIHKTYPTAGPCEGRWSEDLAVAAGLTRKSVVTAPEY